MREQVCVRILEVSRLRNICLGCKVNREIFKNYQNCRRTCVRAMGVKYRETWQGCKAGGEHTVNSKSETLKSFREGVLRGCAHTER